MPRRPAGAKYPHVTTAAKPHNHGFCPVIVAIIKKVAAGEETWGTLHKMPAVTTEEKAKEIRTGFYAARYCREITKALGEPVSIQAGFDEDKGTYTDWVRVWPRSVAKVEIARRVAAGEGLAYNIVKRSA
jgi:hypothetical protein